MKSIEEAEHILADMINAAMHHNMGWTSGYFFRDRFDCPTNDSKNATSCCAMGAAMISNQTNDLRAHNVISGNDRDNYWTGDFGDNDPLDEAIGWAYRQAMESK